MTAERIRSRPYVWQPVAWADQRVMTRGSVDGLPALTWGRADRAQLATARQLRQLGLRPAGAQPVAVLVFGHRQPGRRPVEYTSLYRIAAAAPKRTATPAQRAAIERALRARRTCRECGAEQDYYLSTVSRMCGPCSDAAGFWVDHDDQAADDVNPPATEDDSDTEVEEWWAEHEATMRAEDPHRPVTETDLAEHDIDAAGHEVDQPAEADTVTVPAQRTVPPDTLTPPATTSGAENAPAAGADPTATEDETTQAVQRAYEALARLVQRHHEPDGWGDDRARGEWLARWHADDQAAGQTDHRAHDRAAELEGVGR